MDRFLSNTTNRIDSKGRVSVPASFRAILGSQTSLFITLSVSQAAAEAGGLAFLERNQARLDQMDPLSNEYEVWSFVLQGDTQELKLDSQGRIILSDNIYQHTGITDEVAFVGRGHFFQLWQPEQFIKYRQWARNQAQNMRQFMQKNSTSTPESMVQSIKKEQQD